MDQNSQALMQTFEGVFFAIGQLAKTLPKETQAELIANLLTKTNDPNCPTGTRLTVKAIAQRIAE